MSVTSSVVLMLWLSPCSRSNFRTLTHTLADTHTRPPQPWLAGHWTVMPHKRADLQAILVRCCSHLIRCCNAIVTTGGKTRRNVKSSSDAARHWQITPAMLCASHYYSESRRAQACVCVWSWWFCTPEGALAGWQVQAMGSWRATGITADPADGLSLKKHSSIPTLNFSQSLLNTPKPLLRSICVSFRSSVSSAV